MAKGRKPKEKTSSVNLSQLGRKLEILETLFGNQKKAAAHIGVDVSTYRDWKTGKRKPKPDMAKRVNRIYGQKQKKITDEILQKVTKKQEQAAEKRRRRYEKPVVESFSKWMDRHFPDTWGNSRIRNGLKFFATEYVAHPLGDDRRVRFVTFDFVAEHPGSKMGKEPGQKYAVAVGIYSTRYDAEKGIVLDDEMDVVLSHNIPILTQIGKAWDLTETLDFLEDKFFSTSQTVGKRKFNPKQFIGFK